jgi:hypothetical protein
MTKYMVGLYERTSRSSAYQPTHGSLVSDSTNSVKHRVGLFKGVAASLTQASQAITRYQAPPLQSERQETPASHTSTSTPSNQPRWLE